MGFSFPRKSRLKGYQNPHSQENRKGFSHFLLWQLGWYRDPVPLCPPPETFSFPNPNLPIQSDQPWAAWMEHSSFLISYKGMQFITDPVWSDRCSPLPFIGPTRHQAPPCSLQELPSLDFIFLSHDHYDHLDLPTLQSLHVLYPKLVWIVPKGLAKWLRKKISIPASQVWELSWWETKNAPQKNLSITAVPAQHFSGRGLFDRNRRLWAGYVITFYEEGKPERRVYFAGDTGYNPYDFKQIGSHFGKMDLALLPIGTYAPRAFMSPVHLHPQEAVQIHQDVNAQLSIGGHWGTFRLSEEPLDRPPYDLYLALEEAHLPWETFRVLRPGQKLNW